MIKKYKVRIDHQEYEVEIEEVAEIEASQEAKPQPSRSLRPSQPLKPASPAKRPKDPEASGSEVISAPMPGTVLSLQVKMGDQVEAGKVLLVLEAMKMENEIVAPQAGKVVEIHTSQGLAVNTGDLLISLA
ncbi:biotin/lipoyl-containing protein [Eremococcus coleocola]|uniref:Acetyl-CoA carboxylase biotin carboxyl carrier protein subunit n=1 Tax=Eremococcus coleocola ACS-139-V-Col8 TaxID=908337 RepID=E4KQN7_9LACT|nr:biotin/lipoyl-containing protein [Eremococcus coleocola]EFR30806.1 acetyl-CoA carboxylase biotin carboxyl carrier protein subunit [Eremococcus coleocola ACS-139-V-Col8]